MSSGALTTSRVWSCTTLGEGMDQVMSEADRLEVEERELELQIQAQWQLDLRVLLYIYRLYTCVDVELLHKIRSIPYIYLLDLVIAPVQLTNQKTEDSLSPWAIWCSKMYPSFISHDRCTGPSSGSSSRLPRSKGSWNSRGGFLALIDPPSCLGLLKLWM